MKELYVVCVYINETKDGTVWDFGGIFDDEELAIKACITKNYFVAPIFLNHQLIQEKTEWPDLFYPLGEI